MRAKIIRISLLDNRFGDPRQKGGLGVRIAEALRDNRARLPEVIDLLARFQDRALHEWETLGLTVYSARGRQLTPGDDEAFDEPLFTLGGIDDQEFAWINTHNSMGVVRLRDKENGCSIQLEIRSRFDHGDKQYFLNHLLSKVFGGSLADDVELGGNSFWELLLAIVFRHRLLEACKVGLFKQYRRYERNDLRFRGQANADAHLRQNVPFLGRIAYTSHEITFDNPINHLIRHAMARVSTKWRSILSGAREFNELRHQYEQLTPSWHKGRIFACLEKNMRPIRHPFFHGYYEPLRRISVALLRSEGASLFDSAYEAEGVVFDGSWLWEKYLWTLLKPLHFQHADNRKGSDGWTILGTPFYPDFYRAGQDPSEPRIVLDAKYKAAGRSANDIRQVLAYMFMLKAQHGGLIKPEEKPDESDPRSTNIVWRDETRGTWYDLVVHIPHAAANVREFRTQMQDSEKRFADTLSGMQPAT
jgi:hypothetical protein